MNVQRDLESIVLHGEIRSRYIKYILRRTGVLSERTSLKPGAYTTPYYIEKKETVK